MVQRIPLARDRGVTLVDDDDFETASRYRWRIFETTKPGLVYAKAWFTGRPVPVSGYLHRLLLPGAEEVDHRDGDGLNNQRHNLRPATRSQQMMNRAKAAGCSSRFKGVSWNKREGAWEAYCGTSGRGRRRLGMFSDEIEAAKAYDDAAREMFGQFARLNFP
jgi:hypothetical protein